MNLTLIGMSGCGKSTIGRKIAQEYNMIFQDFDEILIQKYGPLHEIIQTRGEQEFMRLEAEIAINSTCSNTVFSPGGSLIYSPNAMEHLRKNSIIIFLDVAFDEIKKRLPPSRISNLINMRRRSLQELYLERHPLYRSYADFTISESTISQEYAKMQKLVDILKKATL